MHVPAWPVLPSSTLAQSELAEKFSVSSLAGLGMEICNEETCYDDGSGSGAGGSPGGVRVVTLPGTDYTKVIGVATSGLLDLAKLFAIQPGTVQQGGTTLRQAPGFAVPTPATSTNLGVKADTGGSMLIAAAVVGVAALFLLKGKS